MIRGLTVSQVLSIHDELINEFGGAKGLISYELLCSAVLRMHATFDGQDVYGSIIEKAAALLESLCVNHSFLDGNKRTAFVATSVFFEMNGYELYLDVAETEIFLLSVAQGVIEFDEIVVFLKSHVR